MNSGVSTTLKTGNPHIQFNSNTSLPLNQHPEDRGLCLYEVLLHALGGYSSDTPEEASQDDGASPPGVESTADSSGVMPDTSAGEPAAQIQDILHENADNLLEETSAQGSTPSMPRGDATAASPGVKPFPSIRVAPDAPHEVAASTRSNLSVQ